MLPAEEFEPNGTRKAASKPR